MSLGQKTFAILILTVAGLMAVLYATTLVLIRRSFLSLEQKETQSAVERAQYALNDDISSVAATANDYAAWDRTYTFMLSRSPDYLTQEFENDTLQGLSINSILLLDSSGQFVFFKGYDFIRKQETQVPIEIQMAFASDPWVRQAGKSLTSQSGILLFAQGPVLIAACPILTTQRKGPVRGVLVMTRKLDQFRIEHLEAVTRSSLTISSGSGPLAPDFRAALNAITANNGKIAVHPLSEAVVAGYSLLRDVRGKPILVLRLDAPRTVYQEGVNSLHYFLAALCLVSIAFGLMTLLLLRQSVLAPLTLLNAEVSRVGRGKHLSERVAISRRDEIGKLGVAINSMLAALQKSSELEETNEALRREVSERKQAESALEEGIHLATLGATIGATLTRTISLREGLQQSAEAFVQYIDAAFARVWTLNEATSTLELQASAGMYTHLDGPHGKVPVGSMKIGRIAQSRLPHLSNDVEHDPQVSDPAWAKREGMVAFAGYPLIVENRVVGVVAAFARHALTKAALECFGSVADQLAQFIQRMSSQEALHASEDHFRQLFATIPLPIWLYDGPTGKFLEVNDTAVALYGYNRTEFLTMTIADLRAPEKSRRGLRCSPREGSASHVSKHRTKDGRIIDVEVNPQIVDFTGVPAVLTAVQDVTERNRMEVELRHGQKLQAVGELAAGIAHEINTPIQFVGDNLNFLREAFVDLDKLLERHVPLPPDGRDDPNANAAETAGKPNAASDLGFLRREIPKAIEQTLEGVGRVATIVQAMKNFSHPDQGHEQATADLNEALKSTLAVARNEYKYVADVETAFDTLPPVMCYLGDLNQVFLNLLVNAAHAMADGVKSSGKKGLIRVATTTDGPWVEVSISDTGAGIPVEIQDRIFEPFFTTKEVGKGTGQGLALARAIVVEKHGGSLTFDSEVGKGTTFHVRIPVNGVSVPHEESASAGH